jgi:phage pi2 protein 07
MLVVLQRLVEPSDIEASVSELIVHCTQCLLHHHRESNRRERTLQKLKSEPSQTRRIKEKIENRTSVHLNDDQDERWGIAAQLVNPHLTHVILAWNKPRGILVGW